jgi:hypothetical protein
MIPLISGIFTFVGAFLYSRYHLGLEILALHQQFGVLKQKNPRPRLRKVDRLFWTLLRHIWTAWTSALIIVKPETVVSWHRAGFRLFWRLRSRSKQHGRPKIEEVLAEILRALAKNPEIRENLIFKGALILSRHLIPKENHLILIGGKLESFPFPSL